MPSAAAPAETVNDQLRQPSDRHDHDGGGEQCVKDDAALGVGARHRLVRPVVIRVPGGVAGKPTATRYAPTSLLVATATPATAPKASIAIAWASRLRSERLAPDTRAYATSGTASPSRTHVASRSPTIASAATMPTTTAPNTGHVADGRRSAAAPS